jgi:hypothetical protein
LPSTGFYDTRALVEAFSVVYPADVGHVEFERPCGSVYRNERMASAGNV